MSCFIQSKECELKIINKDFNKSFEKIKNNLNGSVKEINRVFEFRSKVREKKMGNLINGCNKNNWEEKIKEFKSIISQFPKSINSQIDSVVNIIKKSDKILWEHLNRSIKEIYKIYDTIIEQVSISESKKANELNIKRNASAKSWKQLDVEIKILKSEKAFLEKASLAQKIALFSKEKLRESFYIYLIAGVFLYALSRVMKKR